MEKLIKIMQKNPDKTFDYVSNNYTSFSKWELADIVKELLYSVYDNCDKFDYHKILEDTAETLAEKYEEEN